MRGLQDDELADVVEQSVHEGFFFVESGPLGDEARHVRRPDAVLEERLAAVTVDVPVLHPRVVADGHDEVANRRRAHADDRFLHCRDLDHRGEVRRVGEAEQPGGQNLILRDDAGQLRDRDVLVADHVDDTVREVGERGDGDVRPLQPLAERQFRRLHVGVWSHSVPAEDECLSQTASILSRKVSTLSGLTM